MRVNLLDIVSEGLSEQGKCVLSDLNYLTPRVMPLLVADRYRTRWQFCSKRTDRLLIL